MVSPSLLKNATRPTALQALLLGLQQIEDPRRLKSVQYPVAEILFIALCAMIAGAEAFTQFEAFGHSHKEWLAKHLRLAHGIPSHDTFRALFVAIAPQAFQDFFLQWTRQFRGLSAGEPIALEGKSLRGSSQERFKKLAIQLPGVLVRRFSLFLLIF